MRIDTDSVSNELEVGSTGPVGVKIVQPPGAGSDHKVQNLRGNLLQAANDRVCAVLCCINFATFSDIL